MGRAAAWSVVGSALVLAAARQHMEKLHMAAINSIERRFTAKLQKSSKPGGWTYVIWPESVKFFGTRGLVKIKGTIDGHPFRSSFMAMGNGRHMLPVKAAVRQVIGKEAGDSVSVRLNARIDR
jgi:hypothetical protein